MLNSHHRGASYAVIEKDFVGCAVCGPYERLDPGNYSVTFDIEPLEATIDTGLVVG